MRIIVKPAREIAIEGVARKALMQFGHDKASIAVRAVDLISGTRKMVGQVFAIDGERWEVVKITPTESVTTLTCRRITDGV